jgi:hypothetical protein
VTASAATDRLDATRGIAEAVEVLGADRYRILGRERELSRDVLPATLELDLYVHLYTRSHEITTRGQGGAGAASDPLGKRAFVGALSGANRGRGTWEAGWRILRMEDDGRAVVESNGVEFWVDPTGFETGDEAPRAGGWARVQVGKELRALVPGFYVAIGDGPGAGPPSERGPAPVPGVRLYWHLTADAAVPYMAAITRALNDRAVPFRTKVLSDPGGYVRSDAGVLYLARDDVAPTADAVREVHARLDGAGALRPSTPLWTLTLAPGLGFAEDPLPGPDGSVSFGQSRCRLAARGLIEAGPGPVDERVAAIRRAFDHAGHDPDRPWWEPETVAAGAQAWLDEAWGAEVGR